MQSFYKVQQDLEVARNKIMYLQGENIRYEENHDFFTTELHKLSNSFEKICMGKKHTDLIEMRVSEIGGNN